MNEDRVIEIFFKSIKKSKLTNEEQQLLDNYLQDSSNKKMYDGLSKYNSEVSGLRINKDSDAVFQEYIASMQNRREKKKQLWNNLNFYAAAVIFAVVVFSALFYWNNINSNINEKVKWQAAIKAGSNKAELILANGEKLDLHSQSNDKEIVEKDGTVIKNNGQTLTYAAKNKKSKKVNNSSVKVHYNSLVVPQGGEYELLLEDGTKVKLNAATRLRYPTQFAANKRVVLLEGEAFFEVSKNNKRPFIVRTNGVDINVLGTKFNVSSYAEDKSIATTLVEGSVEVSDSKNKTNKLLLQPGYQAVFLTETKQLTQQKVDVKRYTAWVDGNFMFQQTSLYDIMKIIARWYNVKVFFRNSSVGDIVFTGTVKRYANLSDLLRKIEKTNEVKFVRKKNVIVVEKR